MNYKKLAYRLICMIFIFSSFFVAPLRAKVARIDLNFAVSLHPKMALFDFSRLGFYKVSQGLTEAEFEMAVAKIRSTFDDSLLLAEQESIRNRLNEIDRKKAKIFSKFSGLTKKEGEKLLSELEDLSKLDEELRGRIIEINYTLNSPELTEPKETKKILSQIENEILAKVEQVANEKNYSLVLNSSIPTPYDYKTKYRIGVNFGHGIPGVDRTLFYSFLARDFESGAFAQFGQVSDNRKVINWLELTHFPEAMDLLPVKPWPLVLRGGDNILQDVLKELYNEYEVDEEIWFVVFSVCDTIEQHFNNCLSHD